MKRQVAVLATLLGCALFWFPVLMQGQNGGPRSAAAGGYTPARTPWGDPDIQGTYTNKDENGTPMARPRDLAGRRLEEFGPKEMAALNQQRLERARAGAGRIGGSAAEDTGAGPSHWYEHLDAQNSQPWLIFDPPEGTIPAAKPRTGGGRGGRGGGCRGGITNSYEDCSLYDRCITRGLPGSMTPAIYGNAYDITQGPGYVAIRYEMIHETRIIPVDGRPGLPSSMRSYMGEPRGRWDGNALVVETTNFREGSIPQNGSDQLKLIERFIPINANTLRWEVRFDDPQTWDRSWAYTMPLKRDSEQAVVEYACHEGNRGLENMLRASRMEEAAAKK